MEKYFEEWCGRRFPVRVVSFPEDKGFGSPVNIASRELWNFIEYDVYDGNKEAEEIDNRILFYCDEEFFDKEPSDKELAEEVLRYIN